MRLWTTARLKAKAIIRAVVSTALHIRLTDVFFVAGLWLLFDGISDYNLSLAKCVLGGLLFIISVWSVFFQATHKPEKVEGE